MEHARDGGPQWPPVSCFWRFRCWRLLIRTWAARHGSGRTRASIAAVFTSTENRKPITNPDFILGSADFFNWSGDINFLRSQINRLRLAMGYMLKEFGVEENGIAYVPWVGHEGRSGVTWQGDEKVIRHGEGIGNNYFDLLPFGAHDAYLNIPAARLHSSRALWYQRPGRGIHRCHLGLLVEGSVEVECRGQGGRA